MPDNKVFVVPGCAGEPVTVANETLNNGDIVEFCSTDSISTQSTVSVHAGADLALWSPSVLLRPGFQADTGSVFFAGPGALALPANLGEAETFLDEVLLPDFGAYESLDLQITAPLVAENGAVIPITLELLVDAGPGTLWLFLPNNTSYRVAAGFTLPAEARKFARTRVKSFVAGMVDVVAAFVTEDGDVRAARTSVTS